MATSSGVAYGSWAMSHYWGFSPYTWMVNLIIPLGAIFCGLVAAIGYWAGSRLFNHRPTRTLLLNIVLVSLGAYFAIHHLDYTKTMVNGRSMESFMSFDRYLVLVTENMRYKDSRSLGDGAELGKWGWGVAALQVFGFSLGGFIVYGMLVAVPYCDRCSKYLSEKNVRVAKWKDVKAMQQEAAPIVQLIENGELQRAIDDYARLGEARTFGLTGFLRMELRKCPTCENRELKLAATHVKGRQVRELFKVKVKTEQPLDLAGAAQRVFRETYGVGRTK